MTIKDGYKMVLDHLKTRLGTYLKRYGLTKVQSWTYLLD